MCKVVVLLSTYNGEKYLQQQLDSLLAQKNVELDILIRDDCSQDCTIDILSKYSSRYSCISYYRGENKRPRDSFFDLLNNCGTYDFYAFCDQDDYWEPEKLFEAISMIQKEVNDGPVLYCSNLKVVDENLRFCRMNRTKKISLDNKFYAFTEFPAVGCTEVFNHNAAMLIRRNVSPNCLMHDSWVFTTCQFFGKVIYDNNAYICYRQHGNNVIGARESKIEILKDKIMRLFDRSLQPRLQNTKAFYNQFFDDINEEDRKEIKKIIDYKSGLMNRLKLIFDNKIVGFTVLDTLRLKFIILFGLF